METLGVTQEKNLPLMLQNFSKNIVPRSECYDLQSLQKNLNQKALVDFYADPRMELFSVDEFSDFSMVVFHLIMRGDTIKLKALGNHFTIEDCMICPSIKSMVLGESLKLKEAISAIGRMVDLLAKYFEVKSPQSLEEISWDFYDRYSHWSIEELVLFFEKCKQQRFSNKFQHIASKGINAEYLFKWAKKFEKQKVKTQIALLEESRKLVPWSPKFAKVFVEKFGKEGKLFEPDLLQKRKLDELKNIHEEQERNKSINQKWIEAIVNEHLKFDIHHFEKHEDDLFFIAGEMAHKKYLDMKAFYKKNIVQFNFSESEQEEIQDVFIEEKDEDGKVKKIINPPLTEKIYLERLMKAEILKLEKRSNEQPERILNQALNIAIDKFEMTSGEELYEFVYNSSSAKFFELESLKFKIISNLLKGFISAYNIYKTEEIAHNRFPMSRKKFINYQARYWACKYCYVKIS